MPISHAANAIYSRVLIFHGDSKESKEFKDRKEGYPRKEKEDKYSIQMKITCIELNSEKMHSLLNTLIDSSKCMTMLIIYYNRVT